LATTPQERTTLRRSLSVWQAVGISVALMAPSMAANINPQGTAGQVGRATPLAFFLAAIAVLLIAYVFVRLCQHYRHAGSVYVFAGATLGARAGAVAGFGLMGTYVFYALVTSSAAGIFGSAFLEALGIWSIDAFLIVRQQPGDGEADDVHDQAAVVVAEAAEPRGVDRRPDARNRLHRVKRVVADGKQFVGADDADWQDPRSVGIEIARHSRQHLLQSLVPAARAFGEDEQGVTLTQPILGTVDRLPGGANDFTRVHHRVLRRHAAALRRLDRREAEARKPALQARIHLRPGNHRQPEREVVAASAMQEDFDEVGVGVGQMVGEDDGGLTDNGSHMFDAIERRTRFENVIGQHVVQSARHRVALVITPVLACGGKAPGQRHERRVRCRVDLPHHRLAHRRQGGGILIGEEIGDRRYQLISSEGHTWGFSVTALERASSKIAES